MNSIVVNASMIAAERMVTFLNSRFSIIVAVKSCYRLTESTGSSFDFDILCCLKTINEYAKSELTSALDAYFSKGIYTLETAENAFRHYR
jgi:hypothetical protein